MKKDTIEGVWSLSVLCLSVSFVLWSFYYLFSTSSDNAREFSTAKEVCDELGSSYKVYRSPDPYLNGHIVSACELVQKSSVSP